MPAAAHLANVQQPESFAGRSLTRHVALQERHVKDAARARACGIRREVLGDEHVDDATARTTEFTKDFQDLITRYAWGEIWSGRVSTDGCAVRSP